jgi:fermentation-respiration switch protein FrsA (DUF1100 family)
VGLPVGDLSARRTLAAALLLLVFCGSIMVLSPALAEALLFQPSRGDPGPPPVLAGVAGERHYLSAADGVRIQAWWYPIRGEGGRGASGTGAVGPGVLLLHGNAGDVSDRAPLARGLLAYGVSVLLLEYRGYGGSEGSPSEEGVQLDALAGYDFLAERIGGPENVVVFGRSMGGAVAARLAATRPTAGLILDSAFTSLEAMARGLYPFLPGFFFRRLRGRFDTEARVRETPVPVLVVHGTEDEIVPFRMGKELHGAAGPGSVWLEVPGAHHNDVPWVGGERYFRALAAFVRRAARGEAGDPAPAG